MKKLFTLSIICIATSILFSSCGSNFNITKRHYNKGYYFAHNSHKNVGNQSSSEDVAKVQPVTLVKPVPVEAIVTNQLHENNNIITDSVTENNKVAKTVSEKRQHMVQKSIHTKFQKLAKRFVETPVFTKHMDKRKVNISNTASEGDGLSLFWIIILILFILWLIGFISTGFLIGSLVNLILLVALILLILWLLRVI